MADRFLGGARGGGKTDGVLGDWLEHGDAYKKDARGILFRRTYDELDEVQDRAGQLFPQLGAVYKTQKREWLFPNGSRLKMRYLARDEDADHYQGHSYTWVCFEEAGNFPSPKPVDKMRACLRSAAGVPCSFILTGNPGGVGHNWLKARYIDPAPPNEPFYDKEMETWRVFIPATLDDNPALTENDPDYWKRVEASASGNESLLKAWRFGDWDIVAGGMFDDLWRRDVHIIKPFEIPESWHVDRSFDWGSSKPFSVGWWAESDGTKALNGRTYPPGTLFRINEWYGWNGKPNEGIKMLAGDMAEGIKSREADMPHKVQPGPADTSIFDAGMIDNAKSIADVMKEKGVRWREADKGPGSRKTGWQRMREYLAASLERPMESPGLFIFNNCSQWIRTVPVVPRDKTKIDDVDTQSEDHIADESRYRVMTPKQRRSITL